jgi:hypothetical protein
MTQIVHPIRVLWLVPALVCAVIVGVPPAAQAASTATVFVDQEDQLISFRAGGGQSNDLRVRQSWRMVDSETGAFFFVFNDTVEITPGEGCVTPDPDDVTRVVCTFFDSPEPYPVLHVRLGDLGDRLRLHFLTGVAEVYGGDGADRLTAVRGEVYLYGDGGHDVLRGHNCDGRAGDDTLTGTAGADTLYGGRGADLIRGGPGNDNLLGESGNDVIYGNSGNDGITGGPGKDRISGGPGTDRITQ